MSFYPDKVAINFQYEHNFSHHQLSRGLFQNGFTHWGANSWAGQVPLDTPIGRFQVPLRITRPRNNSLINCYVDLNVLKALHASTSTTGNEVSTVPGENNWIPSDLVQMDNRWVWHHLDEFVQSARGATATVVHYVHTERTRASAAQPLCSHISVATIEATLDLSALNARHLVDHYSLSFSSLLRDIEHREFPWKSLTSIRPESNWMVHGYIAADDRIKMYAKTDRRVRFEYRFGKRAFARLNIRRALSENRTFSEIFSHCASQAHSTYSALRNRAQRIHNINSKHTPIDFLSKLSCCTRDAALLRDLLDCLLRTGKVAHARFPQLARRLHERGLLQPSLARGFSCVAPGYLRAANMLRRAQLDAFSTKLLQPIATHSSAGPHANRRAAIGRNSATAH